MDIRPRSPATELLLHESAGFDAASWLVPGGEATLARGIALAHPGATVSWQPTDSRERDAPEPQPANVAIEEPGATGLPVVAVVLAAPPERALARRWLLLAQNRLTAGGTLVVAGPNDEGIRPVLADAARLFGPPRTQGYRAKHRFGIFQAGSVGTLPDWATRDGVAPGTWEAFSFAVRGETVPLVTQAGVFAGAKVDPGTRLLLDALPEHLSGSVLDIGCGAGVIGVVAAMSGANPVTMVDVSLLAIQAAGENVRRLGLAGCNVVASDAYDTLGDRRYGLIVSNPPFHRGKTVDLTVADDLIARAPDHLEAGGSLLIVANAFLAYGRRMERQFRRIETVLATRQYHVLRASDPR